MKPLEGDTRDYPPDIKGHVFGCTLLISWHIVHHRYEDRNQLATASSREGRKHHWRLDSPVEVEEKEFGAAGKRGEAPSRKDYLSRHAFAISFTCDEEAG